MQELCVSSLCVVEVHSALSRLREAGEIEESERVAAAAYLMNVIAETDVRPFDTTVMHEAIRVIHDRKLRALDAVQLASAVTTGEVTFVAADQKLLEAAEAEGFTILNPATQH